MDVSGKLAGTYAVLDFNAAMFGKSDMLRVPAAESFAVQGRQQRMVSLTP